MNAWVWYVIIWLIVWIVILTIIFKTCKSIKKSKDLKDELIKLQIMEEKRKLKEINKKKNNDKSI